MPEEFYISEFKKFIKYIYVYIYWKCERIRYLVVEQFMHKLPSKKGNKSFNV